MKLRQQVRDLKQAVATARQMLAQGASREEALAYLETV